MPESASELTLTTSAPLIRPARPNQHPMSSDARDIKIPVVPVVPVPVALSVVVVLAVAVGTAKTIPKELESIPGLPKSFQKCPETTRSSQGRL